MTERVLLAVAGGTENPMLKVNVLDAEMVHPGWMMFRLASAIPDYEEPTTVWYRVPEAARLIELQDHVTDADVRSRPRFRVADAPR
jgi:hypothetical protein